MWKLVKTREEKAQVAVWVIMVLRQFAAVIAHQSNLGERPGTSPPPVRGIGSMT